MEVNNRIGSQRAEGQLVALVRDAQGNVKFDNPHEIPTVFHELLSEEDWAYIEILRTAAARKLESFITT